ncbi:hypothetical protein H671_3g10907 [Cricetulus griseus]|nr:hypothetical protein H671_3g10907 [Cricetulus griseus]
MEDLNGDGLEETGFILMAIGKHDYRKASLCIGHDVLLCAIPYGASFQDGYRGHQISHSSSARGGPCAPCHIHLAFGLIGSYTNPMDVVTAAAQPIVDVATPGLVVLGAIRKQIEQAIENKPSAGAQIMGFLVLSGNSMDHRHRPGLGCQHVAKTSPSV